MQSFARLFDGLSVPMTNSYDSFYLYQLSYLIGGLEHFFYILEIIIPNWLIFFRVVGQPTTSYDFPIVNLDQFNAKS